MEKKSTDETRARGGEAKGRGAPSLDAPVWVLESSARSGVSPASALARRLGFLFRRIGAGRPEAIEEDLVRFAPPRLILSAGLREGLRARALRARYRCRHIHCAERFWEGAIGAFAFERVVTPALRPGAVREDTGQHFSPARDLPRSGDDLTQEPVASFRPGGIVGAVLRRVTGLRGGAPIGTLGPMQSVSIPLLRQAAELWSERLSHMPKPRIAVLLGPEPRLSPFEIGLRTRALAAQIRERGGAAMACVLEPRLRASARAFAAGFEGCATLVWHRDEPGESPLLGFLGTADAVVLMNADRDMFLESLGADVPVFMAEGRMPSLRGLGLACERRGLVRLLGEQGFSPWPRRPLDEAGRVAMQLRAEGMA